MLSVLFSARGRVNRARFWLASFLSIAAIVVVGGAIYTVIAATPGAIDAEGGLHLEGLDAVVVFGLMAVFWIVAAWSGTCLAIKRYHDRDKSGWWMLIQFVPVIGSLWFFIETAFLRGTNGPNRFGGDPLNTDGAAGYVV